MWHHSAIVSVEWTDPRSPLAESVWNIAPMLVLFQGLVRQEKRIKQKKKKRIVVCGGEEQRLEAD